MRFFVLLTSFCFIFSAAQAETCRTIRPFPRESKNAVHVFDFEGPPDVAPIATVLFKDYLEFAKDLKAAEIHGQIVRDGEGYHLTLTSGDALKGEGKWEGRFLYPSQLNDALVEAVDQISRALKSPLPPKKLLPFIYTTTSSSAYGLYAQARQVMAVSSWTEETLKKAQDLLEKTIQADYNYVPGYLALAEVLAARHRLTGESGWKNRALVELQKAKLLLPPLAERREPQIRWYLDGKAQAVCGDNL